MKYIWTLLAELADVGDHLVNLGVGQLAFERRHFVLASGDHRLQIGVGKLLDVRRMEIGNLQRLANRSLAGAVGTVAKSALGGEDGFAGVFRRRNAGEGTN